MYYDGPERKYFCFQRIWSYVVLKLIPDPMGCLLVIITTNVASKRTKKKKKHNWDSWGFSLFFNWNFIWIVFLLLLLSASFPGNWKRKKREEEKSTMKNLLSQQELQSQKCVYLNVSNAMKQISNYWISLISSVQDRKCLCDVITELFLAETPMYCCGVLSEGRLCPFSY